MKGEAKRFKREVDALVQDINPDQIYDIYLKKSYDSKKLFWLENDKDGFNKTDKELNDFIKNLQPFQRRDIMLAEVEAYVNIAYDLRCWLRSESLEFIAIMIAHHHLFGMILDDLDTYEGTGDKYWYDSAKNLLKQLTGAFNDRYWNDEAILSFETYIEKYHEVDDLTNKDKKNLELLSSFTRQYRVIQEKKQLD